MGTFSDSKIRKACTPKVCDGCKDNIAKGELYLDYKLGQRWSVPYHIGCAVPSGCYCAALENRTDVRTTRKE